MGCNLHSKSMWTPPVLTASATIEPPLLDLSRVPCLPASFWSAIKIRIRIERMMKFRLLFLQCLLVDCADHGDGVCIPPRVLPVPDGSPASYSMFLSHF